MDELKLLSSAGTKYAQESDIEHYAEQYIELATAQLSSLAHMAAQKRFVGTYRSAVDFPGSDECAVEFHDTYGIIV